MAVREEDLARSRPLPALQMGAGPAAFVPTTPPTTPYGHLQPLLPDSTDHERISEIDQQALRNLRSFQHPRENNSPDEDLSQLLFPSPSSAGSRESCPSLNSPGGLSYQSRFARRQSAPFAGRPAAPEPGMLLIVAEQLPRPLHPTRVDQELEFWWPLHPGGVVELRFGIMTRRGRFRAMRIRLSIGPGGQPASRRPEQHLMPGSMLPVPGLNEYHPGRRFSTGSAPVPLRHRRYVRGARFGFPAQLINTQLASERFAIIRCLLMGASEFLRDHDEIILPMPYPSAWPETIQFIHTGNRAYLSEMVRSNLLNLGGGLF